MINFVFNGREIIIRVRFVAPLDAAPTLSLFQDGAALVHDPIVGVGSGSVWVFTFTPTGLTIGKLFQAEAVGAVGGLPVYKEVICATVAEWEELDGPPAIVIPPSVENRVTAYYICLDEEGQNEQGVVVTLEAKEYIGSSSTIAGVALADPPRTATSDANGLASFPDTVPGYSYIVRFGSNTHVVSIPEGAVHPFPLRSIVR